MSQVVLDHEQVAARLPTGQRLITTTMPTAPEAATRFIQFVNASPTPFHAVHNAALRLEKAGFAKVCLHSLHALPVFSAFVD